MQLKKQKIVSFATDNCSTMIAIWETLNKFRIPCVCYIFIELEDKIPSFINPFLNWWTIEQVSDIYTVFINNQKVLSNTNIQWTSFYKEAWILLETK